jgi:hypothetical protein
MTDKIEYKGFHVSSPSFLVMPELKLCETENVRLIPLFEFHIKLLLLSAVITISPSTGVNWNLFLPLLSSLEARKVRTGRI